MTDCATGIETADAAVDAAVIHAELQMTRARLDEAQAAIGALQAAVAALPSAIRRDVSESLRRHAQREAGLGYADTLIAALGLNGPAGEPEGGA